MADPVLDLNGAGGGTSATLNYAEGQTLTAVAPAATVTDPDSPDFDGGSLTVEISANGTENDRIAIIDQGTGVGKISISEAEVFYNFGTGPELIGSYFGGTDGFTPLVITFNASATPAAIQALARTIGYFNISQQMTDDDRMLTWTLTDGDGGTAAATATIDVTTDDDPAVAQDDGFFTDEDSAIVAGNLFGANGNGNDLDPDGDAFEVTAVNGQPTDVDQQITLASGALLTVRANGTFDYDPNGQFETLAGGSGAVNSQDTETFTYTITGGDTATVTITISGVTDPGDRLQGSSGDNIITGTAARDFFSVEQGGSDIVSGLGDNDIFYFGAAFTSADAVDGGDGTDVVALQGNYTLTFGADDLTRVESLSVMTSQDNRFGGGSGSPFAYALTTVNANVPAGTQLKINAGTLALNESFTFNGAAETDGSFYIFGGKGIDILTGGAGADIFYFAEDGRLGASDVVNGGGGADVVVLRGDYIVTFGAGSLSGVETLSLISASATPLAPPGSDYDYDITFNDANVGSGITFTVNGAGLTAGETMDIDGSAEASGILRLLAGAGNDILVGGGGNDLLHGGLGADTMTGGGGNDVFRYQTAGDSTSTGRDAIQDFRIGDLIDLSRIDANTNTAPNEAFSFIGTAAFTNTAGELRFQNEAATIWRVQGDVDGDGTADLEFLVIVADGDPITAADFIL